MASKRISIVLDLKVSPTPRRLNILLPSGQHSSWWKLLMDGVFGRDTGPVLSAKPLPLLEFTVNPTFAPGADTRLAAKFPALP